MIAASETSNPTVNAVFNVLACVERWMVRGAVVVGIVLVALASDATAADWTPLPPSQSCSTTANSMCGSIGFER